MDGENSVERRGTEAGRKGGERKGWKKEMKGGNGVEKVERVGRKTEEKEEEEKERRQDDVGRLVLLEVT